MRFRSARFGLIKTLEYIDRGGQSLVYLGKPLDSIFNHEVVVKVFNNYKAYSNELSILSKLHYDGFQCHDNIIHVLDTGIEMYKNKQKKCLIYPYYNFGDGVDYSNDRLNYDLFKTCLDVENDYKNIWDAIAYAHNKHVMHLDIKPQNIVSYHENKTIIPVLIDWGLSDVKRKMAGRRGSYSYISPEMNNRALMFDHKTDIWSMGVSWFIIITAKDEIFQYASRYNIYKRGWKHIQDEHGDIWYNLTPKTREILKASLIPNPDDRASAAEIYNLLV